MTKQIISREAWIAYAIKCLIEEYDYPSGIDYATAYATTLCDMRYDEGCTPEQAVEDDTITVTTSSDSII